MEEVDLVGEHQDGQAHHECQYSPDSFCSLKYVKNERWKNLREIMGIVTLVFILGCLGWEIVDVDEVVLIVLSMNS